MALSPPVRCDDALPAPRFESSLNHEALDGVAIHRCSFLHLPRPLRLRIYAEAGLIRPCLIDIERERPRLRRRVYFTGPASLFQERLKRRLQETGLPEGEELCVRCPPLPVALLRVSRAVHADALPLLYGHNAFLVQVRHPLITAEGSTRSPLDPGGLQQLAGLPAAALRALASLHVRLGCSPCPLDRCWQCRTLRAPAGHPEAARAAGLEPAVLEALVTLIGRLRDHLVPGRVRWAFICDCLFLESGRTVAALLRLLPRARGAAVRLGIDPRQAAMGALARETAAAMTGMPPAPSFSKYALLPPELRQQILAATGLAAGSDAPFDAAARRVTVEHGELVWPDAGCCGRCTPSGAPCCCPTRYAAASGLCRCAPPLASLLSATSLLRDDAYALVLSRYVIVFTDYPSTSLRMLRALPDGALRHFRRLRFEFDRLDEIPETWGRKDWLDGADHGAAWRDLVGFLATHLDLARLSLSVDVRTPWRRFAGRPVVKRPSDSMYLALGGLLWPLVEQLRGKGLRSFHVSLNWPWEYERLVESAVMGDAYDAFADDYYPKQAHGLRNLEAKPDIPPGGALEELLRAADGV